MKTFLTLAAFYLLIGSPAHSQSTLRVLFLGNSYSAANDLPSMVADVAYSMGDTVIYDSNSPGGFTFQGHSTDAGSLNKIAAGNWDYVVLQEQSQLPSFPLSQVQTDVFPYATRLDSLINTQNPCAETVFFMTWGRKNGDASNCAAWPPVCTYTGMDSLLRLRYMMMAGDNNAVAAPAGAVWRYIRNFYPSIELYEPDESHPSVAGSFAAACTFYTALFRKDPSLITFNSTLQPADADRIRTAVKAVVFDSLSTWFIGAYNPVADFTFSLASDSLIITNNSLYASQFQWDFGDGISSSAPQPQHVYAQNGTFNLTLVASHCGMSDTLMKQVQVTGIGMAQAKPRNTLLVSPNPATERITLILPPETLHTEAVLSICKPDGQIVLKETIEPGTTQHQTDISFLPAGLWLVSVKANNSAPLRAIFVKAI